jgi:hypothetical protein
MSRQLISPLRPSSPTGEFLSRQIWLRTVLSAAIVCLGGPLVGAAWAQETTVGLALVAGRVLDAESEKPIDGAEVLLVGDATEISRETDNSGAFMFPRVPRGAYQLVVEHLAYGTRSETIGRYSASLPVPADAGVLRAGGSWARLFHYPR